MLTLPWQLVSRPVMLGLMNLTIPPPIQLPVQAVVISVSVMLRGLMFGVGPLARQTVMILGQSTLQAWFMSRPVSLLLFLLMVTALRVLQWARELEFRTTCL